MNRARLACTIESGGSIFMKLFIDVIYGVLVVGCVPLGYAVCGWAYGWSGRKRSEEAMERVMWGVR